jgi:A/G-specific adenine glycosylase
MRRISDQALWEAVARDEQQAAQDQAIRLVSWYRERAGDRRLPWRDPAEPWARVVMVEGLLAQTTAATVAAHYQRVFAGVQKGADWIDLDMQERWRRLAPLGYPQLKFWAMDSLARLVGAFMIEPGRQCSWIALQAHKGIGPYTAGMVATLYGQDAAPVDVNVARVGGRCDRDGDAARWIARVIGAANALNVHPPDRWWAGYEAVCAVLDIGATLCQPRRTECGRCPLAEGGCASAFQPGTQMGLNV